MKDKQYTTEQEQIARFAKAMGHPVKYIVLCITTPFFENIVRSSANYDNYINFKVK